MFSFKPVMSASVLDQMIHLDKKYPTEYTSVENCIEMQVGQEIGRHWCDSRDLVVCFRPESVFLVPRQLRSEVTPLIVTSQPSNVN